jgi:hypothetical protein
MNTVRTNVLVGLIAASSVALGTTNANAASLSLNSTVSSTNTGLPTFTVTDSFLGSDTISLTVTGTPDFYSADPNNKGYITNAAGVLTATSDYGAIGSDGFGPDGNGQTAGALLFGNSTLGYKQLFFPAGSPGSYNTSSTLTFSNLSLSTYFASGLTAGDIIGFKTLDSNSSDNSGSYIVTGSINSAAPASVPEPFTIIGTIVGGTTALRLRKKLKSDNKA